MTDLKTAAAALSKAANAFDLALKNYYDAVIAVGRESANPTERGFDARQVRRKLQAFVVAKLSPRDGILQFDGAPEARRYVAANPLPGLV